MASISYLLHEVLRVLPEDVVARILRVTPEVLRERLQTKDWSDAQEDLVYRLCRARGISLGDLPVLKGGPPSTTIGEFSAQFGGAQGLANLLGVSLFTLRSWASCFPAAREAQILAAIALCPDPRRFKLIPGAWGKGFGIIRADVRGQHER